MAFLLPPPSPPGPSSCPIHSPSTRGTSPHFHSAPMSLPAIPEVDLPNRPADSRIAPQSRSTPARSPSTPPEQPRPPTPRDPQPRSDRTHAPLHTYMSFESGSSA